MLVAISIPIFTAQLKKARLATNQANARAAYAEVAATQLTEGKTSYTGTYSVATAKLTSGGTAATATAIQTWGVSTKVGSVTLGDNTASKWTVSIDKDGNVKYGAQK